MRLRGKLSTGLLLLAGCQATTPSLVETTVMTKAKHLFFVGDRKVANPVPANPSTIDEGRQTFSHYCVVCHGMDGQNTGVPFADRMSPPPPSLASPAVQTYTDGQLKWIVNHGLKPSGMPGATGILTDDEQWHIVLYLRHLPSAGSLGEPPIYSK